MNPMLALLMSCTSPVPNAEGAAATYTTTATWSVLSAGAPSTVCAEGAPVAVSLREGADTVLASASVPCSDGTFVWGDGQGYVALEIVDSAWDGVSILEVASVEDGIAILVIDLGADGDGVDEGDLCTADFDPGQQDADGDGLGDVCDPCPDEVGAEGDGCPPPIEDRDGDGIADDDDDCPDEAGLEALEGCPDGDGDGFADAEDACPDDAGPDSEDGCPDRDGDGVPDPEDACPDLPGDHEGCPVDIRDEMTETAATACGEWDTHEYEYSAWSSSNGITWSAMAVAYLSFGASIGEPDCLISYDVTVTPSGPAFLVSYEELSRSCPGWVTAATHDGEELSWSVSGTEVTWEDDGIGYSEVNGAGMVLTALWNHGCIAP